MLRALLFIAVVWVGLQLIGPVLALIGGGLTVLATLLILPVALVLALSVGLPILIVGAVCMALLAPLLLPIILLVVVIKLALGACCMLASTA